VEVGRLEEALAAAAQVDVPLHAELILWHLQTDRQTDRTREYFVSYLPALMGRSMVILSLADTDSGQQTLTEVDRAEAERQKRNTRTSHCTEIQR